MTTYSVATRSSLELMLEKIKQREKDHEQKDVPPALPVRPVSRGRRLPPARRRPSFQIKMQKGGSEMNEETDGFMWAAFESKRTKTQAFTVASNEIGVVNDHQRERVLQGILMIQKCFRGHQVCCYYHQLRSVVVTIQSFVRGENTRKDYQHFVRRLTAAIILQNNIRRQIVWRRLQRHNEAVICLQSVVRGWLSRRHFNYLRDLNKPHIGYTEDGKDMELEKPVIEDYVQVPYVVIADLQRRVLRAEATLGRKKEENTALKLQLQQLEKKWQQYEAKMSFMEKSWQDQLTTLQMNLAASKRNSATQTVQPSPMHHYQNGDTWSLEIQVSHRSPLEFPDLPHDFGPHQVNGKFDNIIHCIKKHENAIDDEANVPVGSKPGQLACKINPYDELRKLKLRFEEWKKEYKSQLKEAEAKLQKLGNPGMGKSCKKWWEI